MGIINLLRRSLTRRPSYPTITISCQGENAVVSVDWPRIDSLSTEEAVGNARCLAAVIHILTSGYAGSKPLLLNAVGTNSHLRNEYAFGEHVVEMVMGAAGGAHEGTDESRPFIRASDTMRTSPQ